MPSLIKEYNTTSELQDDIDAKIKDVEQRINVYSKKIGDRLREDKELENDDPDVQQIKEAMEGPKDEKDPKNKKKKRNQQSERIQNGLILTEFISIMGHHQLEN